MATASLFVLIFAILAAACFLADALGVSLTRPGLQSFGLFLATLAALILIWP